MKKTIIVRHSRAYDLTEKEVIKGVLMYLQDNDEIGGYVRDCSFSFDDVSGKYCIEINDSTKVEEVPTVKERNQRG